MIKKHYRLIKLNGTNITERTGSHEMTGCIGEVPTMGNSFILYSADHPGNGIITSPVTELYNIATNHYRFITMSGSEYVLTLETQEESKQKQH